MAISRQRKNVAYGVGQPLFGLSPEPISSTRAPTTSDKAELGTVWVNKSTDAAWVLASVASNTATWTPTTVNAGATISTGDLDVTLGDINVVTGDVALTGGDVILANGDVTIQLGALNVDVGNAIITTGDVTVTAGDIDVTAGDIDVAAGNINATLGTITGAQIAASNDIAGVGGTTTVTNTTDTTLSTGAGVVLMKTANPQDSSGWMKIYVGTDVRWVPFWTNLSP
jgi:adhesin HecA-like repeat protein